MNSNWDSRSRVGCNTLTFSNTHRRERSLQCTCHGPSCMGGEPTLSLALATFGLADLDQNPGDLVGAHVDSVLVICRPESLRRVCWS